MSGALTEEVRGSDVSKSNVVTVLKLGFNNTFSTDELRSEYKLIINLFCLFRRAPVLITARVHIRGGGGAGD